MLCDSLLAHPKIFFFIRWIISYVIFVERVTCDFIGIAEPQAKNAQQALPVLRADRV